MSGSPSSYGLEAPRSQGARAAAPEAGTSRTDRVAALDGLRGIAALVVVLRHCFNTVAMPASLRENVLQSPLAFFLNGQGAVALFFVLSGYVLAASITRNRHPIDLLQYCVKRIFRIHPPYVFAVLFAWTAAFFYPQIPLDAGSSPGVRALAGVHIDAGQLLESLLFPGPAQRQLPVGWTLRIEMIFSFLLPLMLLVARRSHWLILLAACGWWLLHPDRLFIYGIDFALGIAAFLERDRLLRLTRATPPLALALATFVALLVFHAPLLLGWSVAWEGTLVAGFAPVEIAIMGAGALGLVIASICVPWLDALLSSRPCRFLGRISYSLYLLHGAFLVLCTPVLSGRPSLPAGIAFFACVVAASLASATLAYRLVERPSIAAGNRICRWLAARAGTAPVDSRLEAP